MNTLQLKLQVQLKNTNLDTDSEFKVSIPLEILNKSLTSTPEVLTKTNSLKELESNAVLVFENDEMSTLLISEILDKNSITYQVAKNEEDAVSKFEKNHFSLIFVGINNPELVEQDLIQTIKKHDKEAHIVALTSHLTKNLLIDYLQNNFDKILLKPYEERDLLKLVEKYRESKSFTKDDIYTSLENSKPSFSLDQLNKISNNSEEFVIKMLNKFIQSATECSEAMVNGSVTNNWDVLKKAAHKAIPSYSIMGLDELVTYLGYIESNATVVTEKDVVKKKAALVEKHNRKVICEIQDYLIHLEGKKN